MTITIQPEVFYIIAITACLCVFCVMCSKAIKKMDYLEKPTGLGHIAVMIVEMIDNMVAENTNKNKSVTLAPYIGCLAMYLLVSNLIGLLGLTQPTGNYSVTLALAVISIILREKENITTNGVKNYLHQFIEPFFPFIIPNIFGKIGPLISMSLRLFGNVLSGTVMMGLIYGLLPKIILLFWPGVLHAYFDVFSGAIQTYVFCMLTMVFISQQFEE